MANWLNDESDEETRRYKGNMVEMLTEMTNKERIVSLAIAFCINVLFSNNLGIRREKSKFNK